MSGPPASGSVHLPNSQNDRCTKQEVDIPLTEAELLEPHRCKERIREVFVKLVSADTGGGSNIST